MKTAEEIIKLEFVEGEFDEIMDNLNTSILPDITDAMIKFAEQHVKAALEAAFKNGYILIKDHDGYTVEYVRSEYPYHIDMSDESSLQYGASVILDKESILDAYPLTNIK